MTTPKELAERLSTRPDLFKRLDSGDATALAELIELGTGATVTKISVSIPDAKWGELAEEFRRLAKEAWFYESDPGVLREAGLAWKQRRVDFEQAAQMVEERLNG